MSTSNSSSASSFTASHGPRFKWLVRLANAVVIVLGICSGYSLAMSHREALKAAEVAVKPAVHAPARPVRLTACEHGRIVRLASR